MTSIIGTITINVQNDDTAQWGTTIIKLLWCGHLARKMCTSYLRKLLYMG